VKIPHGKEWWAKVNPIIATPICAQFEPDIQKSFMNRRRNGEAPAGMNELSSAYSRAMKPPAKLSFLLAVAFLATLALAFQQGFPVVVEGKNLYAEKDFRGKKAPDFLVEKWLNRESVDTRGKVLLIDFWATWCGPCREVIPELNEFQKKYKDKLLVIGISDEQPEVVKKFMGSTMMEYSIGIDRKKRMSKAIGIKGIPHVLIISPDGIVRWQGFPGNDDDPLTEKIVKQIIDASNIRG
jgi:cytochrome c biogenesis protein CcmG, thiol:disulfide interchange protein DsbE